MFPSVAAQHQKRMYHLICANNITTILLYLNSNSQQDAETIEQPQRQG